MTHPLVVLAEEPYWRLREEAPDWVRELRTLSVVCTCPAPAAHVLHAAALFARARAGSLDRRSLSVAFFLPAVF